MKQTITLAAALALAACGQDAGNSGTAETNPDATSMAEYDETGEAGVDAGFEAVAPGSYEVVHQDGTIDSLTVHPGLTWSMVTDDGNASGGTIFAQGGKNCFVTEGVEGHECYGGSPPADDGSMTVTAEDGSTATVRPVSVAGAES